MGKIITNDIYLTAFLVMNEASCLFKWNDDKCTFHVSHNEIEDIEREYNGREKNVNARQYVIQFKNLARAMNESKKYDPNLE